MSVATILLATGLATAGPISPAAIVSEVLSGLPADTRVTALHWDGHRMWVGGDGVVPLTTDGRSLDPGWPRLAGAGLSASVLAGGTVSDTDVIRRPTFLLAHELKRTGRRDAPVVFEGPRVWFGSPQYSGGEVELVGVAAGPRALADVRRVVELSPCLRDVSLAPLESEGVDGKAGLAFVVRAQALGDLTTARCAPVAAPVDASVPEQVEVRGDWSVIWGALQQPWPAPVEAFTVRAEGDELVLELNLFVDARFVVGADGVGTPRPLDRKQTRALSRTGGAPADGLRVAGLSVPPPALPSPLSLLGHGGLQGSGDAPAGPDALVAAHGQQPHTVLSGLDTTLVDLRSLRLQAVRAVHAQVLELDLDVALEGSPQALSRMMDQLGSGSAAVTTAPGAGTASTTITVPVAIAPEGPRGLFGEAIAVPTEAPPDPFAAGPGWAAYSGQAAAPELMFEPLVPFKTWHLSYLGLVGVDRPVGLVQVPDGRVMQVGPGARVGDVGGVVTGLDSTALHLSLPGTSPEAGASEVALPAVAHPPDEAPLPATHVGLVSPEALATLRSLFPDGNTINIDVSRTDPTVLIDLLAREGVPVLLGEDVGPLPRVSVYARGRSVGELLTDLQLVLLPHGLVFDETLVLLRDEDRARRLSAALFGSEKVALHTLDALAEGPAAKPLHVSGVDAFDILRLFRLPSMLAPSSAQPVTLSASHIEATDLVAALEASLAPSGQHFWWAGDRLVVVGQGPAD